MAEQWKDVQGYEGFYQVSDKGSVRRARHSDKRGHVYKERMLNPTTGHGNYLRVNLSKNGKTKWHLVHRVVATAFVDKPDGCDVVNHLDNNPTNNRASNLEWTTYAGNMQHAAQQGRMRGNRENLEKAINANKKPVVSIKGGKRQWFESGAEAGRVLGVNRSHIAACCRQEYGYKTLGGYRFEYADPELQSKQKPNKVRLSDEEYKKRLSEILKGNKRSLGVSPSAETRKKLSRAVSKPVDQYELDGTFVKSYYGASEARRQTGITHIDDCAAGRRKTAGGYLWRYREDNNHDEGYFSE